MIEITFQAVSKVIVAVLVGAFCCGSVPNSATTMRDFSFLISNVLLPALTVTNTASAVNLQMLIRCSILLFFGVVVIFIGIGSAIVMSYLLFGVKKTSMGFPAELAGDVRLDLHYDDAPVKPDEDTTKKKSKKDKKKGMPYVAVILSKKMREMGVDGHEIVAEIEPPALEVEEFPFYYWGAWVACSIQNTVTLPLSLLQNLCESVPWLNFSEGTAYIFVFSITASLYIWSCGPLYVESAQKETTKRRLIREIITQHKKMLGRCDAVTQTDISYTASHDVLKGGALREDMAFPSLSSPQARQAHGRFGDGGDAGDAGSPVGRRPNPLRDGEEVTSSPLGTETVVPMGGSTRSRSTSPPPQPLAPSTRDYAEVGEQTELQPWSPNTARRFSFPELGGATQVPYNWETAGYLRVKYADDVKEANRVSVTSKVFSSMKQVGGRLVRNIPFMSIVVGMFIGVVPPIRGLFFDGGALEMITDAVTLVGQGNIPAALLLLGANLVGSSSASSAAPVAVRMRDSEQNTDFPLVPAHDSELLGDASKYAEWYNQTHENMEFDEHASFSLQTILQQQATERIAAARAAAAAAEAARAKEEAGEEADGASSGTSDLANDGKPQNPRLRELVQSPTRKTTSDMLAQASANTAQALDAGFLDEDEAGKKGGGCMDGVHRALSLNGVKKRFVWGVIIERLLITPALGFLLLIALINTMPFLFGGKGSMDRTILVVLFMELAAPTAINSALLFNQRDYMTYPWAKMLFFQYILCTVTLVMWATIGLEYVARYVE